MQACIGDLLLPSASPPGRLRAAERRIDGGAKARLLDALREAACEPDGVPGAVVSLQTFGSFGASFHPHLHVFVTDGVFTRDGCFHPVIWPEEAELEERFRRRFLLLLVHAVCQQIPDPGMHLVRYREGAYSNRRRRELVAAREALAHGGAPTPEAPSDPGELLPPDVSFEDAPPPPASTSASGWSSASSGWAPIA